MDATTVINSLMGLLALFGGLWMKNLDASIKENREATAAAHDLALQSERRMNDRLGGYVPKDEFREFRDENRDNFNRLFQKMDDLKDQVAKKADR